MPRKLTDLMAALPQARRKRIRARAMELAALKARKKLGLNSRRARTTA
jgi:hypothetical protein